ncbi:MAG: ABC transporter substrate-binding protein [bacterium]|nr:ABC transporter substrate-binding protein [bacterium]
MRSLPLMLVALVLLIAVPIGVAVMLGQATDDGSAAVAAIGAADDGGAPGGAGGDPTKTGRSGLQSGARPQGHVYAGVTTEPADVNPFTSHEQVAQRLVLGFTHEGLLDIDPTTGELRGAVAESWKAAPDGMSCTFRLRDGIRFSDGSPVTMADVLFGYELAAARQLSFGFLGDAFQRVASAEAVSDRELRVEFGDRHYASVRIVGERWLVCKREFFVGRVRELAKAVGSPAPAPDSAEFALLLSQIDRECGPGTGPMQLPSDADGPTTWRPRQDLTLVNNPHHWRRLAEPGTWNLAGSRLLFRSSAAVPSTLKAGEIDWLGNWSADAILASNAEFAARYRRLVYDYESLGVLGVLWNCALPELRDPRVRRALAMLVDREAIIRRFGDGVVSAVAFAKPDSAGYPSDLEALPFDPRAARALLREAGFDAATGKPLRLSLLSTVDGGPMDLTIDLLRDTTKQAGIELTVETLTFGSYVAKYNERKWSGVVMNRAFRPWGDPTDFVHSTGADNDGGWQNAEADRLATAAQGELDADKRAAIWRELHELVYREQPFLFLVHPRSCILFNKHIQDAEPGPRGLWPERWWVPAEHQRK